jgi:hypothetical protein
MPKGMRCHLRSRSLAAWFYLFSLFALPATTTLFLESPAIAQTSSASRAPTSELGRKIAGKSDEVVAIAFKVASGLMAFYLIFIIVKFASGNGREAWHHLMYFLLAGALLAALDQVVSWSQT